MFVDGAVDPPDSLLLSWWTDTRHYASPLRARSSHRRAAESWVSARAAAAPAADRESARSHRRAGRRSRSAARLGSLQPRAWSMHLPAALPDGLGLDKNHRGLAGFPRWVTSSSVSRCVCSKARCAGARSNCFLPLIRPCPGVVRSTTWRSSVAGRLLASHPGQYRKLVPRAARSAERVNLAPGVSRGTTSPLAMA